MYSLGDPTKSAKVLNWRCTVEFTEIMARMIRAEQEHAQTASNIQGNCQRDPAGRFDLRRL
jgi:hypothetical protein